ncbi:MAG: response regulator [Flavobacteriales bacterium]
MKVLIVEDELLIAKVYSILLKKEGHQVIASVTHPDAARASIETEIPDAVVLDINLKGGANGIAFARELRAKYSFPILFTTGNSKILTQEAIADISNCDVMSKPVEAPLLLKRLLEMSQD